MNRNFVLLTLFASTLLCGCTGRTSSSASGTDSIDVDADSAGYVGRRPVTLPGPGNINVEDLLNIDLNMDISQLTLAELRVLRNAFAARHGYAFMSQDLRSLFSTTSWYDSLFCERWERVEDSYSVEPFSDAEYENERESYIKRAAKYVPITYTAAEQAFMDRIAEREKLLANQNFVAPPGEIVNTKNIINPWQIEDFPEKLRAALGKNGFAIVPSDGVQLFHIYEQNDYNVFPSFVTTDLYLQLFHFYFDCVLRDIEEQRLDSCVNLLCQRISKSVEKVASNTPNKEVRAAAEWLQAYCAIAEGLHVGKAPAKVPARYAEDVKDELEKCTNAANALSPFLGYREVQFAYSLFRPRGHYTTTERLQRYFRMMMWLQTAPFATDNAEQMQRAALLAHVIGSDAATAKLYSNITEPMTFLLGEPDNVSLMQVADEVKRSGLPIEKLLTNAEAMKKLTAAVEKIAEQQTRIRPKHLATARHKLNLMPQRYMPDAEMLQEMVDDKSKTARRKAPKALDIMAAMGVSAAERILIHELHEAQRWPEYPLRLDSMRRRAAAIDWNKTVATRWIDAIATLSTRTNTSPLPSEKGVPYFMLTPQWQKKNLNTALASYAELKHDAILYAKQPFGAECGGGGPPEPVIRGYVEPAVAFWKKAVELNKAYTGVLTRYGLMTDKAETASESLTELAEFLLSASEKELRGQVLKDNEYDQIEIIGSTIEYISLGLARRGDEYLASWDDIQGADRSIACIADVYTANGYNIPSEEKAILYEAVGPAYEIYVIVEIDGQLWLTRGGVFSYRELERPLDTPRLTDEEWQKHLEENPDDGIPSWMKQIIVPLKNKPKPNAEVFYSSGC